MTTMLPRPAPAAPAPKVTNPGVQMLLAVVGSVCGTLAVGAVGTSPTAKLVGAALGAAIPAVMTLAGPYPLARAVAGVAITGGLVLTYGGFTLVSYATDQPSRFPLPPAAPEPAATSSGGGGDPSGPIGPGSHGTGLRVAPDSIHCADGGCDEAVRVSNDDDRERALGDVAIDPGGQFAIRANDCGATLAAGASCAIGIEFTPAQGAPSHARLVIPNPAAEPLSVALDGDAATATTDLEAVGDVCAPRANDDGSFVLPVAAGVAAVGGDAPAEATVAASVDGGAPTSSTVTVGGDRTTLELTVTQEQLDQGVAVTVTADPDDEIADANPINDTRVLTARTGQEFAC
jgi:hypothetical protein